MSIAAKVSSAELTAQVTSRFASQTFEAALIYAPGTAYQPGITNDTTFKGFEVAAGTGGYLRQTFSYSGGDVLTYSDDGVGLTQKATIFTQNGTGTTISFSHVALLRGNGNVLTLGSNTGRPTAAVNGTYLSLPTSTAGSGKGLRVNLTVTSSGAALGNYAVTIASPGYGYSASDVVSVLDANLALAGAITAGAGNLTFSVGTVTSGGGQVVAVAQTANTVVLGGGNQSVFYWNLKQFGYYTP
jgi:hypothetical protein